MFGSKKNDRREIFKKAMLTRGKRTPPRRSPIEKEGSTLPWTTFFLWLAFGIVSCYILFFSPGLSVNTVEVVGKSILPMTEYQSFTDQWISGRYFGFFPRNNFFLVPMQSIQRGLYEQYPKIARVSLERQFPAGIRITLEETPLLFRWCSGGPCYGLRENQWISLHNSEDPRYESVQLSVIDESALPVVTGEQGVVDPYFQVFGFFYQEFPRLITTTIARTAYTPSRHSSELVLTTEEGWSIRLSTDRSPESSLRALQVFLESYSKEHPDRTQLAQVDLRVDGKIFFSERAETATSKEEEK